MGGLLAARVLADSYDTVTVVERDVLPDGPEPRRGVPQGRQPHLLLARAAQILEELFPGFLDELVADGGLVWDDGDLSKFWVSFAGHRLVRDRLPDPASVVNYYGSRPFLEGHVRRRLRGLANVSVLDGHDVAGLTATADRRRVTGVRVVGHDDGNETTLTADLVVDATGRGSRTPVFLEQLGYGRPREDELVVRVAYASQPLRLPHDTLQENLVAVCPEPDRPSIFAAFACENDTWLVAVGTMAGIEPPATWPELLDYAAGFAPAHVLAAVRDAETIGGVNQHRLPSNRWRRYDKMAATPDGLLVVGDAICSFNPIYGQGMTVAAIEAGVLRDCLRSGERDLPRRFFSASAKKIRVAWQTAVGSDLTLPQVAGPRPLSMRITNAWTERVLTASETDAAVAQQFLRVVGMLDEPSALLRPGFVLRVLKAGRRAVAEQPEDSVAVSQTWL